MTRSKHAGVLTEGVGKQQRKESIVGNGSGYEAQGENIFSLTRSPYLNDVIKDVETIYYEQACPEIYFEPLKEKLAIMQEVARSLEEVYAKTRQTQEMTPTIIAQDEIIEQNLAVLKQAVSQCESIFSTKDKNTMLEALSSMKNATISLFYAFDCLKEEEQRYDTFSQSPYFNELIRITNGVIEGRFPPESLGERLAFMRAFWERTYKEFTIYKTQRIDSPVIAETIPVLEEAYCNCGAGLAEMALFYEDGDLQHLSTGIATVKYGSDILVDSYAIIDRALHADEVKSCLRCGGANDLGARVCSHCQAVIPNYTSYESTSKGIDITVEETITAVSERYITTNIMKLMEVVEGFRMGDGNPEDLANTLEWLWNKIQQGKEMHQKMQIPTTIEDQETIQKLELSRDYMADGIQKLENALIEMNIFFEDGEVGHLTEGLELALAGNDDIVEVQRMGLEIWVKHMPPQPEQ